MLDKGKKKTMIGSIKEFRGEDYQLMSETGLLKVQIDELRDHLKKLELLKNGSPITKYELLDILKKCGFIITEQLKKHIQQELEKKQNKRIDQQFLIDSASIAKTLYENEINLKTNEDIENLEYINAFLALGGGPDTEGFVSKNNIINIIKNEFELTFDMTDFLEEIASSSDQLDYQAFCRLFETGKDDDIRSVTSKRSFISSFSTREQRKNSFHVKYKDFLRFCELESEQK